jgi:hypothetical protein
MTVQASGKLSNSLFRMVSSLSIHKSEIATAARRCRRRAFVRQAGLQ